ncbi:MAG: hypothetical protein AMXMBFR33_18700 [Candidatus Xenobia bacterium]
MNACEECREQLPGLVLQALEADEVERLQAHLTGCAGCQESLAELRVTFQAADAWQVPDPPADLRARIQLAAQRPTGWWHSFRLALDRLACYQPSPRAGLVGLLLGICLFGLVLYPTTQRYYSGGTAAGCRNNQNILRSALADYARDHQGRYPASLDELHGKYLQATPICPESAIDSYSATYQVSPKADRYTLSCQSEHGP